jgi:hypothetical protein
MNAKGVLLVVALFLFCSLQAAVQGGLEGGTRTPDNNDTPGTATAISSGIPVSDSVNGSDDQYDFYKISGVVAGQTVRASVTYTDSSAQLNLSIRNPSGNNMTVVSGGGLTRGNTVLAGVNGTYIVEIKAHTGASDYTLTVTAALPPIIEPGNQTAGNLSTSGADRTDFYRFWLDANISGRREVGHLNMTQSDQGARMGAAFVDILRYRGSHVYNESWNISRKANMSAAAAYTGWYYCQVYAISGASGYALDLSRSDAFSDGDNEPANATAAPLDSFFNGRVTKAADHYDWYSYRVAANDNLHIEAIRGNSTDRFIVSVYNSSFVSVVADDNWKGGDTIDTVTIDVVPILTDMTYFVAVEASTAYRAVPISQWTDDDSRMDYTLSFTSPNHPPQIIAEFENLTLAEDTKAHLVMPSHFKDADGDRLNFTLSGASHIAGSYICATGELEISSTANWNGRETAYIRAWRMSRCSREAPTRRWTVPPFFPIMTRSMATPFRSRSGTTAP